MLNETDAVVPAETQHFEWNGDRGWRSRVWPTAGFNVTVAQAGSVESVMLMAVTVTVVSAVTLLGAV